MKIADGELRQILLYDLKLSTQTVRELVADSRQSKQPLIKIVLASKVASDAQIAAAHAKRIGVPFVDLAKITLADKTVRKLPRQLAARYKVICFDVTATSVKIAMADPRDEKARKALRDYFGKTIRRYLATDRSLTTAMGFYRKADTTPLPLSTRDLLATILEQAAQNGSRDIHFEPQDDNLIIKRRVGKSLVVLATLPLARYRALISWCKVQAGAPVSDTERPHHGQFTIRISGLVHTVSLSTVPVVGGEKMVLRLVPPAESIPSLQTIGYGPKDTTYIKTLIQDGRGLVIVAGGHGSDVPTTLASMAAMAAQQPHTTVNTIEEPIQYHINDVVQVEVTHAVPFLDIVSAVVAQNPGTIITSDLGKGRSAEQLIDFSLSHHLVISGLYGTSLHSVISKLMNYPIAPALLAASLRLLIVQHQIEALCKYCRTSFTPAGPLKKALWDQFGFTNQARLYRKGPGCSHCQHGNHQTVLATEWLPNNQELQQLIATNADARSIRDYITQHSDYPLHLGKLAAKGLISIDEATQRVAQA
jgi:type II secretory ATPase GspE/PulE/Tfp pilus assembly ATPase PilB-like protein